MLQTCLFFQTRSKVDMPNDIGQILFKNIYIPKYFFVSPTLTIELQWIFTSFSVLSFHFLFARIRNLHKPSAEIR